jgi:hypothetical protein
MTDVRNQPSRFTAWRLFVLLALRFFEIARVLMRFDHFASFIVNANHSMMRPAAELRVMRLKSISPLRMRD